MKPFLANLFARRRRLLIETLASLIILLYSYASLYKLCNFSDFINEINKQPLPKSWTPYLVRTIPTVEIAASLLLCFRISRLWGFLLSSLIMTTFTGYTIAVLLHGFAYIPCACGGIIEDLTWGQHLVLDTSYLLLSIIGAWLCWRKNQSQGPLPQNHKSGERIKKTKKPAFAGRTNQIP